MKNTVLEATTLQDKKTERIDMCNHEANEGKVFVLVEGSDDEKIYRRFLSEQQVTFYITKNCLYVVELLRALKTTPALKNRLIGIKDADFDHILHRSYPDLENLFLTDYHDIEMTILSKEFENALKAEYTLPEPTSLIEKVEEDLKSLSYLRLYNEVTLTENKEMGIDLDGINFNDITYSKLYDGKNPIACDLCLCYVKSKCNNARLSHFPTNETMDTFTNKYKSLELRQLTRGHDLVYALQVRLQELSGNDPHGYNGLCLILRSTCTQENFEKTILYHHLNEWMNKQGLDLWSKKVA